MGKFSVRDGPVSFQPMSNNRKLSNVEFYRTPESKYEKVRPTKPFCCSTYVSIEATCPDTCRFKDCGCYVQAGWTQRMSKILDKEAVGMGGLEVIQTEADLVNRMFPEGVPQDGAKGGRDLRFHIGGDTSGPQGTALLARAAMRWKQRGGGAVWAYTHRWREIAFASWYPISVLASVETAMEADEAHDRGYPVIITLANFSSHKVYKMVGSKRSLSIIPCPSQVKGSSCISCRLCLTESVGPYVVGVALHGTQVGKIMQSFPVLEQEELFK